MGHPKVRRTINGKFNDLCFGWVLLAYIIIVCGSLFYMICISVDLSWSWQLYLYSLVALCFVWFFFIRYAMVLSFSMQLTPELLLGVGDVVVCLTSYRDGEWCCGDVGHRLISGA